MLVVLAMVMQLSEKVGEIVIRELIAKMNEAEFSIDITAV